MTVTPGTTAPGAAEIAAAQEILARAQRAAADQAPAPGLDQAPEQLLGADPAPNPSRPVADPVAGQIVRFPKETPGVHPAPMVAGIVLATVGGTVRIAELGPEVNVDATELETV